MPLPKLSKTQFANIRNRFYVFIHLYMTNFRVSPELMVTYHLTCPWFQLHQRSEPMVSVASFKAIHASAMLAPLTLTWCEQLLSDLSMNFSKLKQLQLLFITVMDLSGTWHPRNRIETKTSFLQLRPRVAVGHWVDYGNGQPFGMDWTAHLGHQMEVGIQRQTLGLAICCML